MQSAWALLVIITHLFMLITVVPVLLKICGKTTTEEIYAFKY